MKTLKIHLDKNLIEQAKELCLVLNITLTEFVNRAIKYKLQELKNDRQI